MIVLFAAFFAVASAAPHDYGFSSDDFSESIAEGIFDVDKFSMDIEKDIDSLDHSLDEIFQELSRQYSFPNVTAVMDLEEEIDTAVVVSNEHVITVPLTGFDEKDIEVVFKTQEGLLTIQAVHKDESGNQKTYMETKTLPSGINTSGTWTYCNDVLKIIFPLKKGGKTADIAIEKLNEDHSLEEMDKSNEEGEVANSKEEDNEGEFLKNEISSIDSVEATTYAVDFSHEIEFIPVEYIVT